jgi:hypothetical protein
MKILMYFFVTVILLGTPQIGYSAGGWLIYRQGPFKGKVLDAETKEPIKGAVVVAQYHMNMLTVVGYRMELLDIQEAVTDAKGEFHIPVYTTTINPLNMGEDVSFLIWKPGYRKVDRWGGYFFVKEPGTIENLPVQTDKGYQIQEIKLGIVELSSLKTKEERRMNPVGPVGDKRDWKKQKQFIKLIREEWKFLTGKSARDLYQIEEGKE